MSTLFKQLSEEELQLEKNLREHDDVLIPTERVINRKLTGIKVGVLGAFLLSLAALAAAGFLYQALGLESQERRAIESSQAQLQAGSESLQEQVDQYRTVIYEMREKLNTYADDRKVLKKQVDRSGIELSNLRKKLIDIEERNRMMQRQAVDLRSQLYQSREETPLMTPVPGAPESRFTPEPEYESARTPNRFTVAEIAEPEPVVQNLAEILTINRKFNFVVVNIGMRDGVKMGDELTVLRQGKPVASLQVEKLYDNFSAATIMRESSREKIREGDSIAQAN